MVRDLDGRRVRAHRNGEHATAVIDDLVASAPAIAAVELFGITRHGIADEHHVRLSVNGVVVADTRFDDLAAVRVQEEYLANVLVNGVNTMQVTLLADTGVAFEMVGVERGSGAPSPRRRPSAAASISPSLLRRSMRPASVARRSPRTASTRTARPRGLRRNSKATSRVFPARPRFRAT